MPVCTYVGCRIDGRKTRLLETALFFIESLQGLELEYEYSMVGHSGSGPEAEKLIEWGQPPVGAADKLRLLRRMAAHTQFCHSGDQTYEATALAIAAAAGRHDSDERFVFVVSDADLERYNKSPAEWNRILGSDPTVRACAVLIVSNEAEAERIRRAMEPGRGYVCTDTGQLGSTFERIFEASVAQ